MGKVAPRLIPGQYDQEGEEQGVAGHLLQVGTLVQLTPQPVRALRRLALLFRLRHAPRPGQGAEPAVAEGLRILWRQWLHLEVLPPG